MSCNTSRQNVIKLGVVLCVLGAYDLGWAQSTATSTAGGDAPRAEEEKGKVEKADNPYTAFAKGLFGQALEFFVDQQIENPRDPKIMMNIGASHYKMKNYEEAENAFRSAILNGDKPLRARAYYNLGNVAFRQGKLQEAIEYYQSALDHDPNETDAKFNLEYVRDEIRRRHEEAQKNQQNQDQQQNSDGQQEQNQDQGQKENPNEQEDRDRDGLPDELEKTCDNPTDPGNSDTDGDGIPDGEEDKNKNGQVDPGETDPNKEDTDGDGIPDQQDPSPAENSGASPEQKDSDQDGLSDAQEEAADNPTDPQNPDSDGDGVPDGEEDKNKNGRVDENETDPNKEDTDGDGVPDAQEEVNAQQGQAKEAEAGDDMSEESAQRYLQALEEGRPEDARKAKGRGRRGRSGKDW